jgi:hypothetical protein
MAAAAALAALACGALLPRRQPEPILVATPAPPAPVISMAPTAVEVAAEVAAAAPPSRRKPSLRPRPRMNAAAAVRPHEELTPMLPEPPEMPVVLAQLPAPAAAPLAPLEEAAEPPAPAEKPRKAGNRFIRAIGKLNPFRQRS